MYWISAALALLSFLVSLSYFRFYTESTLFAIVVFLGSLLLQQRENIKKIYQKARIQAEDVSVVKGAHPKMGFASKSLMLEALQRLPEGMVIFDQSQNILWANSSSSTLLGVLPRDYGTSIRRRVSDPEILELIDTYTESGREPQSAIFDSPLYDSQYCRIDLLALDEQHTMLYVADTTEQVTTQKIRMDFVANASHELRTPLTVINGYIESLIDVAELRDDDMLPKSLVLHPFDEMYTQSNRIMNIINDLLLLSRADGMTQRQDLGGVNIRKIIEQTVVEARSVHGHQYPISTIVKENRLLKGHETLFQSLVANLIFNAINHNEVGTEITVFWLPQMEGGAELIVEDLGQGIPPHHLERITERFYRVDKSHSRRSDAKGGGTGLGLAIVKHAVNSSGGQLKIESELGEGSRFICSWPASAIYHTANPAESKTSAL